MYADALDKTGRDHPSEQDSAVLEAVVWRKFDTRLLPMCTAVYLMSFFDINNIANARVAGMQTALNISDYQFTVALTLTLVPYIAMELPSNLILKVSPLFRLYVVSTSVSVACRSRSLVACYGYLMGNNCCHARIRHWLHWTTFVSILSGSDARRPSSWTCSLPFLLLPERKTADEDKCFLLLGIINRSLHWPVSCWHNAYGRNRW